MSYCVEDLTERELVNCDDYPVGGIDVLALIQPDADISDYEDPAAWAAADPTKIRFIYNIRAEFPEPEPVTGTNPVGGGPDTIVNGFNFKLNFEDYNATAINDQFWANANGRRFIIAWREPQNGVIKVVEEAVTVMAKPAKVPFSGSDGQLYVGELSWKGKRDSFPVRYQEPAGVFDIPE